jgi:hypothetical protein
MTTSSLTDLNDEWLHLTATCGYRAPRWMSAHRR